MFIILEGADGVGKTSVGQALVKMLKDRNKLALYTRDPGTTELGEKIRQIVKTSNLSDLEYTLLFSASLANTLRVTIKPMLETYDVVILDRWVRSTYIYQGYYHFTKESKKAKFFSNLASEIIGESMPDYEFVLTCDTDLAWNRVHARDGNVDVFESKGRNWFNNIHDHYKAMLKYPSQFLPIFENGIQIDTTNNTVEMTVMKILDMINLK